MEEKVSIGVAHEMVTKWLDGKKISDQKRIKYESMVENIVDAVVAGHLTLDEETLVWKLDLCFPIGLNTDFEIKTLSFKPRVNTIEKNKYRKSVKPTGDAFQDSLRLTLCALTDASINVVDGLDDSTDKQVADSIAIFFV